MTAAEYIKGIFSGDTTLLGRAITLVESRKKSDRNTARKVVQGCIEKSGNSFRLGITGPPGVGKSTFIDALGHHAVVNGKKVAVLAVDPSSARSQGSILGDKTRMMRLFKNQNAFIRPSPSSGASGGIGAATREAIILCEAAGFDFIIVETVGVGQNETAVHSLVDFFLLLQMPGAGDELQGIKRGILELADAILINKADGDNREKALKALSVFRNALILFGDKECGWIVPVEICSAQNEDGIDTVWSIINDYHKRALDCGSFMNRRSDQLRFWFYQTLRHTIEENIFSRTDVRRIIATKEKNVLRGGISPVRAAEEALREFKKLK